MQASAEYLSYQISQARNGIRVLGVGAHTGLSLAGLACGPSSQISAITAPGITAADGSSAPASLLNTDLSGMWIPNGGAPITAVTVSAGIVLGVVEPSNA